MTARKTGAELLFQVKNAKQLSKALRRVNPIVPPRHMKRQKWEAERYAVVRLLKSIHRLPYPVVLIHDDKPDFRLTANGWRVAIEAVEAVPEVDAHRDRVIGGLVASGAIANPIQSVALRSPSDPVQSRKDASKPDTVPHFYGGDEVEENWASAMQHFIGMKLDKFPSYAEADEKWIMVYDNWPSIQLDVKDASIRVYRWLQSINAFHGIDSIYIIHLNNIIKFSKNRAAISNLKSPKRMKGKNNG